MSQVSVVVRRLFGEIEAVFTTEVTGLQAALAAAHELAGIDQPTATAASSAPTAEAKTEKPAAKAGAKKADAPAASSQPGAKQETTAPPAAAQEKTSGTTAAQPSSGGDDVTYEGHVKPAILQIAKDKGRDMVTALMQRYGATKGPELKVDQYADFHKDALRVLAGEYDPTVAEQEEALA